MESNENTHEPALLIRGNEAERLDTMGVRLYADHRTTHGRFSANATHLPPGAGGPPPHFHTSSAELFYLLGGALRVLAGDEIHTLHEGDLLVVPPNMPHAWAATPDAPADALIIFTPGIERFDYFRLGDRIRKGEASPQEILDSQDRYDNHFVDSPVWRREQTGDSRDALTSRQLHEEFSDNSVFRTQRAIPTEGRP